MIHEVRGDLLLSRAHVVAHGVGPDDDFRSGLALALRERWPAMYKDFRHACHTTKLEAGDVWTWAGPGLVIVNLLTQEPPPGGHGHSGKATVANVNHALRKLRQLVEHEKFPSLALPRLATGVGGLEWSEVKPLIEHHLGDLPCHVYIYTQYHAGETAAEPT